MTPSPVASPIHVDVPALREWAATCAAIEAGEQVLLIRKGGISEPGFEVESRRFLLLPTLFHQAHGTPPIVSEVEVRLICDIVGEAQVPGDFPLEALSAFHHYEPEQLATRVRYKPEKPLTLLAIKPSRLDQPFILKLDQVRPVCRSWQSVPVPPAPGSLSASAILTRASVSELLENLFSLEARHAG